MRAAIQIKRFAPLGRYLPDNGDAFPVDPGETVHRGIQRLDISMEPARLIFLDCVNHDLSTALSDREIVAVFPPVGGG